MALLKENINNLIVDDLNKRNQNWTTIDESLELKADKTYVDNKVKTDVPVGAKFTDTVYSHPASHPASMITGLPTSLPANGGNADTVGGFTIGVSVPANAKFTDTVVDISGKADKTYVDDSLELKADKTYVDSQDELKADKAEVEANLELKADKTYVDNQNALKADISYVNELAFGETGEIDLSHKADITYVDSQDALKADKTYVDNKVQTDVPVGAKFTDTITTINGKTGAISKDDIVALGIPASDTGATYEVATPSADGLMSSADKSKLDGVAAGANNYVHPGSGTNPHGTTKADVGLSSVLDYGMATQTEAETGTSNDKYMTPLRTKQAIDKAVILIGDKGIKTITSATEPSLDAGDQWHREI